MAVVHDGVAGVVCVQDPVVGRRAGDWALQIRNINIVTAAAGH